MSLLTIVQGAALRCNYATPSTVIGNTDANILLFAACAQDIGDEMTERVNWQDQKISTPATFTGDGTTTLFALPSNFQALSPSDTFVSSLYPTLRMFGPVNEDDLLRMKALPVVLTPSYWRQVDNKIEFFPALAAGEIVSYVYAGDSWINTSGGSPVIPAIWAADTNVAILSERTIMLGTVWKWKRTKGFDYAEEFATYERSLEAQAGQESTQRIIPTSNLIVEWETTFPGTITDNTDKVY